jgi:hypothetical protein
LGFAGGSARGPALQKFFAPLFFQKSGFFLASRWRRSGTSNSALPDWFQSVVKSDLS